MRNIIFVFLIYEYFWSVRLILGNPGQLSYGKENSPLCVHLEPVRGQRMRDGGMRQEGQLLLGRKGHNQKDHAKESQIYAGARLATRGIFASNRKGGELHLDWFV